MKRVRANFPTVGVIILAVGLTSAIGQTGRDRGAGGYTSEPAVSELQQALRDHEARIDRLEARAARESPTYLDEGAAGQPLAAPPSGAGRPPARVMILDSVETVEADPAGYEELERLQRDVDALQRTVDQMDRSVASMSSSGGGYSRGYKNTSSSRRRSSQGKLLADYRTKLRKKEGDMKRLERELNEPKQILHGHWESKIISLETTRDQSRALDRIDTGNHLTWSGRRHSQDANSEEWIVTRIEAVDRAAIGE
ncbi:MAG: hypothetical protein ACYTE6_12300 [Planctomycetota bacterium]|jgi:hypothetical protein